MTINFGAASNGTTWRPEPTYRGTYSILSSCLITMTLCIWTAVHLNLPEHGKATRQTWRKLWWLTIGLFAPELVAWTAFEQYREARHLHRMMKAALGEEAPCSLMHSMRLWMSKVLAAADRKPASDPERITRGPIKHPRRHKWTMTHSHYASMGGFAFDTKLMQRDFLPEGRERLTLTTSGVLRLAEVTPHLLPDISVTQINDKSKANKLAKTVVVMQASWFSVQCVSRMALGLPLSLLELNTFAHALCALIAYLLWWNKPLDVEEPTRIEGPDMDLVCAGMCMRSTLGSTCLAADFVAPNQMVARLWFHDAGYLKQENNTNSAQFGLTEHLMTQEVPERPVYVEVGGGMKEISASAEVSEPTGHCLRLYMGQSLYGFGFRRGKCHQFSRKTAMTRRLRNQLDPTQCRSVPPGVGEHGIMALQRPFVTLSAADVLRLQLARKCYEQHLDFVYYPAYRNYHKIYEDSPGLSHTNWLNEYVTPRVQNWPRTRGSCRESDASFTIWSILVSLFFAGFAYGGLHILAWSPPVSSAKETIIWRISAISVIAVGATPLLGLATLILYLLVIEALEETSFSQWLKERRRLRWINIVGEFIQLACGIIVGIPILLSIGLCPLLYAFSRVYLVAECIISIPHLPDGVFETVSWSQYFPHVA